MEVMTVYVTASEAAKQIKVRVISLDIFMETWIFVQMFQQVFL